MYSYINKYASLNKIWLDYHKNKKLQIHITGVTIILDLDKVVITILTIKHLKVYKIKNYVNYKFQKLTTRETFVNNTRAS